jgi:hypothetical protein
VPITPGGAWGTGGRAGGRYLARGKRSVPERGRSDCGRDTSPSCPQRRRSGQGGRLWRRVLLYSIVDYCRTSFRTTTLSCVWLAATCPPTNLKLIKVNNMQLVEICCLHYFSGGNLKEYLLTKTESLLTEQYSICFPKIICYPVKKILVFSATILAGHYLAKAVIQGKVEMQV